ncbi:acylneuraminate cytidylyltransferase family protein [Butyrivibrio sp. INlla21]|uniref:acylneuraminate cytidylyltransferase family protein n=1 Tax=Butyrivibrio sp. INlla21 TaxID=1520811 RepID=UPI0008E5418E|nr:acylneuraminate cytidylyltransferase family protein [Butyrivibrio sp. INlla21]SFV02686.1 CMP-N,N'-diacetyllegionaminic acid synthase [Butyrivibrio sp. INlla21]
MRMRNIAIIPARSGSKGLQDKNIKELAGKPLIAYTIEAALKSECFDEVMVSTDSSYYADIAKKYGANVPFLRSDKNSTDKATSWDMVDEVLSGYKDMNKEYDTFCLLQPTSPLRTAEDIKNAYELYKNKASFAVVSVCEAEHSPLWCGQLPENGEFIDFISPESMKRRQDAGKFYRLNGAIYIVDITRFQNDRFFYKKGSFAYVMEQDRSVDIDTEIDFKLAQIMIEKV